MAVRLRLVVEPAHRARGEALAAQLDLAIAGERLDKKAIADDERVLVVDDDGVSIVGQTPSGVARLRIDYERGAHARRLQDAMRGDALILRAVGARGDRRPRVLDATAGLCRDALSLAARGCAVTAIERVPVLVALVEDALERAQDAPWIRSARDAGFRLISGDAADVMRRAHDAGDRVDVVVLDPMFPAQKKSAQVKKEMALLHDWLAAPDDAEALFDAAQTVAPRVVVKRPRTAPPLADGVSFAVEGKAFRFDVYACAGAPAD